MKNPFPMASLALLILACVMFAVSAHAQVLGWVLVCEDDMAQDFVILDTFTDQDSCLAFRDDIINTLGQPPRSIYLYCAPVRSA